jgi:hypothetical protein
LAGHPCLDRKSKYAGMIRHGGGHLAGHLGHAGAVGGVFSPAGRQGSPAI